MGDVRNVPNGNSYENQLYQEPLRPFTPTNFKVNPFTKVVVVIVLTITVFVLLITGTATTAISYPPQPPKWQSNDSDTDIVAVHTALDGNYKLLGPLLLMAGIFLLLVDSVLCFMMTREAYFASRSIRPSSNISAGVSPMSVLGGPFFLAVPTASSHQEVNPFAYSNRLWSLPNAPFPEFSVDGGPLKGSRIRPATATLGNCHQPPFNPDVEPTKPSENSEV